MGKLLEGRAAVVTGSGRGIGRAVAIAMAEEGARVVVNDPGVAPDGTGSSPGVADQVVEDIRKQGGIAVANHDSVATMQGGENIIRTAIESFGRLDILVNNAGIVRPGYLVDMTEEDWDITIAVHLKGHFACTRPAVKQMIRQKYGRIINVSSQSALGIAAGNISYASAKGGILAFTRTLAHELGKHGITVNAIMPRAEGRMIDALTDAGFVTPDHEVLSRQDQKPEDVAPVMVFLATEEAANFNGCTILARVKGVIQLMSDPMPVKSLYREGAWSLEQLLDAMPKTIGEGLVNPFPPEQAGESW